LLEVVYLKFFDSSLNGGLLVWRLNAADVFRVGGNDVDAPLAINSKMFSDCRNDPFLALIAIM